jgi:L-ribulokinase
MDALALATQRAPGRCKLDGQKVEAIALDTTGSTVVPVDEHLTPLDDYFYLWADHRAKDEAALITEGGAARLPAIEMCGGVYSSSGVRQAAPLAATSDKARGSRRRSSTATWSRRVLSGETTSARTCRGPCARWGSKWLWSNRMAVYHPRSF